MRTSDNQLTNCLMKQIVAFNTRQRFKATPQLRHAIGLLQLSSNELRLEIQQAVEANAFLEIESESPQQFDHDVIHTNAHSYDESLTNDSDWSDAGHVEDQEPLYPDEYPDFDRSRLPAQERYDIEGSVVDTNGVADQTVSLSDHLIGQMNVLSLTVTQEAIARTIIDGINSDGMLETGSKEVAASLLPEIDVSPSEIESVLKIVQDLEPPGVGARNLQECLLIQLRLLPKNSQLKRLAIRILTGHFEVLASQDYKRLSRILETPIKDVLEAIELVRSLNPRPGSVIGSTLTEYVKPDVIVREDEGQWRVRINPEATPRIRINPVYAQPSKESKKFRSNDYVREHLKHAKLFLKSIERRNSTLASVCNCIVEHQKAFLKHGLRAIKPLKMAEIASELGIHVSTVSRITTHKYVLTPQGLFPLKYFFSQAIPTRDKVPLASIVVQELIRNAINNETKQQPLSDELIAKLLESDGVQLARRTVTKYRKIMAIPASAERKKQHWNIGNSSAAQ